MWTGGKVILIYEILVQLMNSGNLMYVLLNRSTQNPAFVQMKLSLRNVINLHMFLIPADSFKQATGYCIHPGSAILVPVWNEEELPRH
jgi:hypothetical protein